MFNIAKILRVDKESEIKNFAFIYFFRPISIFPTYIFYKLKFVPNGVTYLRIVGFLVLMSHPLLSLEFTSLEFFMSVLLLQILDFCDGNLARIMNMESLYGKFIDSIADTLLPITHLYIIYYYFSGDVSYTDSYIVILIVILYLASQIISNKNTLFSNLSNKGKHSYKTSQSNKFKVSRSIFSSFIFFKNLYIVIFILFDLVNFLIYLLLFISFLELMDSLRDVNKSRKSFKEIKYSKLRNF